MKAIILAAGYATRLYPLTKDKPKPLLDVNGKPILEHIIKRIEDIDIIDEIYVVTNNKFFTRFLDWKTNFNSSKKIIIVNDMTKSNEDRLGSLGDIRYVIDNLNINDDIIVIAGDNLFEFSLKPIIDLYKEKHKSIVALYDVKDKELAKLYGIVTINDENKVIDFQEKPSEPKSTLSSTGVYVYPKEAIEKLFHYVDNHDADKAGSFLEWLHNHDDVYGYVSDKNWFDIGSLEQLKTAKEEFRG